MEIQINNRWHITISNRPSFFGFPLDGSSAREVRAYLKIKDQISNIYPVYWRDRPIENRMTFEPGQQKLLELFHWSAETKGYFIVDENREPIRRLQNQELAFTLILKDHLGRNTEWPFNVVFDDTHLKNTPRLQINFPTTFKTRFNLAKDGARAFFGAFRSSKKTK